MSVQAKFCGPDRRWYMYKCICEALRDCFTFQDADTIALSILFCLEQKKKYIKKPKKKQKLSWNTDARNRTWAVRVRVRYRSPYTIAEILKSWLIIISNHMA